MNTYKITFTAEPQSERGWCLFISNHPRGIVTVEVRAFSEQEAINNAKALVTEPMRYYSVEQY